MIRIGNQCVTVDRSWTDLKKVVDGTEKKMFLQFEEESSHYCVFAVDENVVYTTLIYKAGSEPSFYDAGQIAQNAADVAEFEALWKAKGNKDITPRDGGGIPRAAAEIPDGSKFNVFSVNWCDPTTWYAESTPVSDETLSDSGDGLTFNSANENWIDMTHGKMTAEDDLTAGGDYLVTVTVNDVEKTQSSPGTADGDYQVNFAGGDVTFNSSQSGNTVKAAYWYATTGTFTVKPLAGKKIKILYVEVQFSRDITLNDTMLFQPFGYAGVFAPHLVPSPLSATDLVPLAAPNKYKTARDFVNESNGCYPLIPGFGGGGWRGLSNEIITLPWRYLTRTELYASYGMEIRVSMENNVPHGGELGTATFYCISEDE